MEPNKSLIFKKIPTSTPVAGEHLTIEERPIDLAAVPPRGGLLVKNLHFSFDPYLRGRMRDVTIQSYSPAYRLDEPIRNSTVSKVLKSSHASYGEGDLVVNYMEGYCQQYTAILVDEVESNVTILNNPLNIDPIFFLGPLGMPGLTAYSSFYEIARPKEHEMIFISAASGAVGSLVGQLAKRAGLRVIGSVGDDTKLKYILNDLSFDAGFNYKEEAPMEALKRLAPEGIDIYFENVGGAHLEAALERMKLYGRIVVSGMIADYNKPFDEKYGVKNLQVFFEKRLRMQGFIVSDLQEQYTKEHQDHCQRWIKDGSLQVKISVTTGIDHAIDGLLGLFNGKNFGKAVLQIWDK